MIDNRFSRLALALVFGLVFAAACTPAVDSGSQPGAAEGQQGADHDHVGDHGGADHEHSHDEGEGRIANEGAVVRITSPADGATFRTGEQIIVEIETENFELGEAGNHWHVYVDGSSWGMVMGANHNEALSGIEPGEHEISVYLSINTHEELEQGDSVTITVAE